MSSFEEPTSTKMGLLLAQSLHDPDVTTLFDDITIEMDILRSSTSLKQFLQEVAHQLHRNKMIPSFGMHAVHVRLNAINFLLVQELCTPRLYDLFGRSDLKLATAIIIHSFTLFRKVELLFSSQLAADAIPTAINSHRCHLFTLLMQYKRSSLVPFAVTLREHGPPALQALTAHLLTVTALGEELRQSIEGVIQQLIALPGPLMSDDHLLLLLDFFNWASRHTLVLQADCRKEELISAVDSRVRASLRSEQYESPQHLIDSYHSHYQQYLTHIAVPLQPYSTADIEQVRKDLMREELCVNKQRYLCGMDGWAACRIELKKVITFVFGLASEEILEEVAPLVGTTNSSEVTVGSIRSEHSSSNNTSEVFSLQLVTLTNSNIGPLNSIVVDGDEGHDTADYKRSLSNTSFASAVTTTTVTATTTTISSQSIHNSNGHQQQQSSSSLEYLLPSHIHFKQPSLVYHDLLCVLHAAILMSASRTFAGGDAFILLHELYGGEGLVLSALPPSPLSNNRNKVDSNVKIAITANGLKVTLRVRYLLQSAQFMAGCSDCRELQPLMGFDCCTTTLLLLSPESLSSQVTNEKEEEYEGEETDDSATSSSRSSPHALGLCLFRALVLQPQRILHRAVSIQPFLPSNSMTS